MQYLDTASFQNSQSPSESCSSQFNENEIISLINVLQNKIKLSKQESLPRQINNTAIKQIDKPVMIETIANIPTRSLNLNLNSFSYNKNKCEIYSENELTNTVNPNLELNSSIQVFNGYFKATSIKNQLIYYGRGIAFDDEQKNSNENRICKKLVNSAFQSSQKQCRIEENFQEKSPDINEQSLQQSFSDILVESEQNDIQGSEHQTFTCNQQETRYNQYDIQNLVQENKQIKLEVQEINKKLDQILHNCLNDRRIIEALRDNLVCVNRIVNKKEEDFQDLKNQHTQLIMQLPLLLNQSNHEQNHEHSLGTRNTLETTKDFINSFIDNVNLSNKSESEIQPSNRRKSKEKDNNLAFQRDIREKENRPPQLKKRNQVEDQQIFEEFRNFCFKKKL